MARNNDGQSQGSTVFIPNELPFPSLTKSHVLSCSFDHWYPAFRKHTPKTRILPCPRAFIDYLRADGIILPPDTPPATSHSSPRLGPRTRRGTQRGTPSDERHSSPGAPTERLTGSGDGLSSQQTSRTASPASVRTTTPPLSTTSISSLASDSSDDEEDNDPSVHWQAFHAQVRSTIAELGGKVVPKLNWSSPKDATQFNATNDMTCRTAGEVYLLLKASDFVSHDLTHVFDGCTTHESSQQQRPSTTGQDDEVPYVLVLRKHFTINPSLEFRAFVRRNVLVGITQRDLNHYPFLLKLRPQLARAIVDFWTAQIRGRFGDGGAEEESYTFDVYVPSPYSRVWILDFNPWDRRTDPYLWSWLELLTMDDSHLVMPTRSSDVTVRLRLGPASALQDDNDDEDDDTDTDDDDDTGDGNDSDDEEADEELARLPQLRLVAASDPEAYMFNSPRYGAHKLPSEVVDASAAGVGGMREFAEQWREIVEGTGTGRGRPSLGGGAGESDSDDEG